MDSETVLFEDKDVKVTNKFVYIKWYFFPTARTKKIPLKNIKKVEKRKLGWAKGRLWGMDATQWGCWLAGDIKRFSRTHFIAIHVDSRVKPSFTTQNIDQIYTLLQQLLAKRNKSEKEEYSEESLGNQKEEMKKII